MSEWISVEERLPKEDDTVWIYTSYRTIEIAYLINNSSNEDGPKWFLIEEDTYIRAKYWMPLIKPSPALPNKAE